MRAEQLAAIRQKCIEANPEIVELKFGCALLRPSSGRPYKVIEDMTWGANTKEVWINSVPFGSMSLPLRVNKEEALRGIPDDNGEVWRIIGRPIRLADVLLAMGMRRPMRGMIYCTSDGVLIDFENRKESGAVWNLRADDLDQQSDETISFIHSLLI